MVNQQIIQMNESHFKIQSDQLEKKIAELRVIARNEKEIARRLRVSVNKANIEVLGGNRGEVLRGMDIDREVDKIVWSLMTREDLDAHKQIA